MLLHYILASEPAKEKKKKGATAIAGSVKDVSQLRTLNLLFNRIGDEGAKAIAGSLKDVPQLQPIL